MTENFGYLYEWLSSILSTQSLWFIFSYGVLSATIIPGASELNVYVSVQDAIHPAWLIGLVATLGNTAGGVIGYWLGAIFPRKSSKNSRVSTWIEKYGYWTLLLTWLPGIGDTICVAAGWLRMDLGKVTLLMFIGKGLRYIVLILFALYL